MQRVFHVVSFLLKWNLKWLLLSISVSITSILLVEIWPDLEGPAFIVLYPSLWLFPAFTFFSSFQLHSGRYLQSLSITKGEIIWSIAILSLCATIPIFLASTWYLFRAEYLDSIRVTELFYLISPSKKGEFFSHAIYIGVIHFFVVLWFVADSFSTIRYRYKGLTVEHFLCFILGILIVTVYMLLRELAYKLITFDYNIPLVLKIIWGCSIYAWIIHRLMLIKLEWYFRWKRLGAYILLCLGIIIGCIYVLGALNSSQPTAWRHHYQQGPSLFKDIYKRRWKRVEEKINSDNLGLDVTNESGVSVIHALVQRGFPKKDFLRETFRSSDRLLTLKMRTKSKICENFFYCDETTPIHLLASKNYYDKIFLELTRSARNLVHIKNKINQTPLHYAAASCAYKNITVLLESGSYPNAQDDKGNTPLILAADNGCCPVTSALLLRGGADINIKNKNNKTATQISRENNKRLHFFLKEIHNGK